MKCFYCDNYFKGGVRVAREFWLPLDHSMGGPMYVVHKPEEHSIHLREVFPDEDEWTQSMKLKRAVEILQFFSTRQDLPNYVVDYCKEFLSKG